MRNFKATLKDAFEFYTAVVKSKKNSKEDPEYKNRLEVFNDNIKIVYSKYDECYSNNELGKLVCHGYSGQDLKDLHKLYSYNLRPFQLLKQEITTTDQNRKIATCQNCTISEINSFDHYVPQTEFPEFVINPKNLIPSCTICNGHKNNNWRSGDKTILLNLYLDILPDVQYLFVGLKIDNDNIVTDFVTKNVNGIDENLYKLIERHYLNLHLLERFAGNNDLVIIPLINSIIPRLNNLPIDIIKAEVIATSKLNMKVFGANFWKSILEIELINNDDFINKFILIHK